MAGRIGLEYRLSSVSLNCRNTSEVANETHFYTQELSLALIRDNPDLAMKYNVMSIPTLLVFKNGEVEKRLVGAKSKGALLRLMLKQRTSGKSDIWQKITTPIRMMTLLAQAKLSR